MATEPRLLNSDLFAALEYVRRSVLRLGTKAAGRFGGLAHVALAGFEEGVRAREFDRDELRLAEIELMQSKILTTFIFDYQRKFLRNRVRPDL